MAFAAPVMGAISTVSQISGQRRQAESQRAQIQANQIAARQQFELSRERFQYAKNSAEATYLRERALLDETNRTAFEQLKQAELQQSLADIQQDAQQQQFTAQTRQRADQLIASASAVEGQAAQQDIGIYNALAQRLFQGDQQADEFVQRLVTSGQAPEAAEQFITESLLSAVSDMQQAQQASGTVNRVAGYQAGALRQQGSFTNEYGSIVNQLTNSQQAANKRFQQFLNQRMPTLLDLQARRNDAALKAAQFSKTAEMNIAQEANSINYQNQMATGNAQMRGIQGPGILGAISQIGSQTIPFLLDSGMFSGGNNPAAQPQQFSFGGPDLSGLPRFGARGSSGLNFNSGYNQLQDVPMEIPFYG